MLIKDEVKEEKIVSSAMKGKLGTAAFHASSEISTNSDAIKCIEWLLYEEKVQTKVAAKLFQKSLIAFSWLSATEDEINTFRNRCIDLISVQSSMIDAFLNTLIACLKPKTKEGDIFYTVRLGDFEFTNKEALRKKLRSLVRETEDNGELEGENLTLVKELLKHHPDSASKLSGFKGIFVSTHKNVNFKNTRTFFIRKDNASEDFSYIRCLQNLHSLVDSSRIEICRSIKELFLLFPSCAQLLVETLERAFPSYRLSVDDITQYTKAVLWFSKHLPVLRIRMMKLLIIQMTFLDAEIKLVDPNSIDLDQMEIWKNDQLCKLAEEIEKGTLENEVVANILGNPNWFSEMYLKVRSEEDINQTAHRLDCMICVVFEYLHEELLTNREIKSTSFYETPLSDSDVLTESDSQVTVDRKSGEYRDSKTKSKLCMTVADVMVNELLDIFEEVILPTHRCKYIQFIFFFIANSNSIWSEKFLQFLFIKLYDPLGDILTRRLSVAYIASFICRSKLLPEKFCYATLKYLLQFLYEVMNHWNESNEHPDAKSMESIRLTRLHMGSSQRTILNPESLLSLFYTVCQAVCYIICYLGKLCMPEKEGFQYLIGGELNLCYVLKSEFTPLVHCKRSIVREFIATCRKIEGTDELEEVFREQEIKMEEKEEYHFYWVSDPLDSVFPFDPYLLRHSSRFIREKYREWPSPFKLPVPDKKYNPAEKAVVVQVDNDTKVQMQRMTDTIARLNAESEKLHHQGALHGRRATAVDRLEVYCKEEAAGTGEIEMESKNIYKLQTFVQDSMGFSAISRTLEANQLRLTPIGIDELQERNEAEKDEVNSEYSTKGEDIDEGEEIDKLDAPLDTPLSPNSAPVIPGQLLMDINDSKDFFLDATMYSSTDNDSPNKATRENAHGESSMLDVVYSDLPYTAMLKKHRGDKKRAAGSEPCIFSPLRMYFTARASNAVPNFMDGYYSPTYNPTTQEEEDLILNELDSLYSGELALDAKPVGCCFNNPEDSIEGIGIEVSGILKGSTVSDIAETIAEEDQGIKQAYEALQNVAHNNRNLKGKRIRHQRDSSA